MRTECLNYKYSHDDALPISRLIASLGNKMQMCTQRYDRRPYGVGLLVAGYDVKIYMKNFIPNIIKYNTYIIIIIILIHNNYVCLVKVIIVN